MKDSRIKPFVMTKVEKIAECKICNKLRDVQNLTQLGDEVGQICDDCFSKLSYHMCDNCDLAFGDSYCFDSWLNDESGDVGVICAKCSNARRLTCCSDCGICGQRKHFINLETRGIDYNPIWKCKGECYGIGFCKQPMVSK